MLCLSVCLSLNFIIIYNSIIILSVPVVARFVGICCGSKLEHEALRAPWERLKSCAWGLKGFAVEANLSMRPEESALRAVHEAFRDLLWKLTWAWGLKSALRAVHEALRDVLWKLTWASLWLVISIAAGRNACYIPNMYMYMYVCMYAHTHKHTHTQNTHMHTRTHTHLRPYASSLRPHA